MAPSKAATQPLLGTVLVVGGCGFLGMQLVQTLIEDPACGKLYVLDRILRPEQIESVTYLKGSITDASRVNSVLKEVKPQVIFHTASPNVTFVTHGNTDFYETNVKGTEILLTAAREQGVRALVFTSSTDAYANPPHNNISEDYPLRDSYSPEEAYSSTKGLADSLVLAAASPNFRTVSLRVAHLYGDGDSHAIPVALDACAGSKPLFQLGDGKNLMEVVSTRNTIDAHVIASKALMDPSLADGEVNGEAFNVADGAPVEFWHFFAVIWSTARGHNVRPEMWVIPGWLIWILIYTIEWLYFIFTLGMVRPKGLDKLERTVMEYCLYTYTYNSEKLRKRLRFKPIVDLENVLVQSVEWELRKRKQLELSKKKG